MLRLMTDNPEQILNAVMLDFGWIRSATAVTAEITFKNVRKSSSGQDPFRGRTLVWAIKGERKQWDQLRRSTVR